MTERKIALSIEEAADYTGIGRNTLRKLVEWKKLPVLKVGRKVLIKTDILEKFMEANEGRDLRDKGTGLRLRLPGSFRRRGFQPDLLMPQGALLRRGRSDSFTSAKPEEDAVGNQCRIRQKGGIVSWRYFTLQ